MSKNLSKKRAAFTILIGITVAVVSFLYILHMRRLEDSTADSSSGHAERSTSEAARYANLCDSDSDCYKTISPEAFDLEESAKYILRSEIPTGDYRYTQGYYSMSSGSSFYEINDSEDADIVAKAYSLGYDKIHYFAKGEEVVFAKPLPRRETGFDCGSALYLSYSPNTSRVRTLYGMNYSQLGETKWHYGFDNSTICDS
ncbi:MAG: hypothetical protein EOO17_00150 [Chloroflexi bacterium]|nr:MAG: hypothetical protein EOO17_00150 [Chloroflexota bacterium]